MKFESRQAYIDSFTKKIRTVSGRDDAEQEVAADVARIKKLQGQVREAVAKRDAELAAVQATIDAIISDRSSYLLDVVVRILKPQAALKIRKHEGEMTRLKARRARLFDREMPLDICLAHLGELMTATGVVEDRISDGRASHSWMLDRKKQERAAEKNAHERSLAPYRKRIELGEAALGKTRAVAAKRKKALSRKHPCPYCGGPLGKAPVNDHIYPVARGGLSTNDNMVFACTPCNQKKRDFTLAEFIHRYGLDMAEVHKRLMKQNKRF